MKDTQDKEIERLVDKSIEAFILGLEIYNKPTIRYRVEGFSFFMVNAWELMLKAELIKRGKSIYYKDHPDRTIAIEKTVRSIYTDKNTRVRLNLERIIDLRNISTHYITEDYEQKYVPLFQACVLNYTNEIERFHNIDISEHLSQNFLMLATNYEPLDNEDIRIKYPPEIAEKLIQHANDIDVLTETYNSDKFSINVKQNLYITKKKSEADFTISIDKESVNRVAIVKDLKDPANTHKFTFNSVITAVQEALSKKHIRIDYENGFNKYVLQLVIDFYGVKQNPQYTYVHKIGKTPLYTYSQGFVDFIVGEIEKNPTTFVESLKKAKR